MADKFFPFITQVMPADGWHVVFLTDTEPYYHLEPMIAWALVENLTSDGKIKSSVVGIALVDGGVYMAEDRDDFHGYAREHDRSMQITNAWSNAGRLRARKRQLGQESNT
jgi:hypothetical protein